MSESVTRAPRSAKSAAAAMPLRAAPATVTRFPSTLKVTQLAGPTPARSR